MMYARARKQNISLNRNTVLFSNLDNMKVSVFKIPHRFTICFSLNAKTTVVSLDSDVFSQFSELSLLLANFTRVLKQFSEHFIQGQFLRMCRTNEHGEKQETTAMKTTGFENSFS